MERIYSLFSMMIPLNMKGGIGYKYFKMNMLNPFTGQFCELEFTSPFALKKYVLDKVA